MSVIIQENQYTKSDIARELGISWQRVYYYIDHGFIVGKKTYNQKKIDSKILNLFSKGSKENKEQLKKAFHSVTYRDQTFNRIAKYYIVEK